MKISLPKCFQNLINKNKNNHEEQENKYHLLLKQSLVALGPLLLTTTAGMTFGYSAILLPQLQLQNSTIVVSKVEMSWIASMAALPMALGCVIGGILLNKLGRKITHAVTCIPIFLGWLLIYLANHVTIILIGRFITGLFAGILAPVTGVYIGETSDPTYRGFLLAGISFSVAFGLFLAHLIGTFLTWKNTALICSILPLISQIIIYFAPESPAWLAEKGKIEEAKQSFHWCRGYSEESKKELDLILERRNQSPKDQNQTVKEKLSEILVPEFLKPLMILTVYVITKQWCGINAIAFYSVAIMKDTVGGVDEYLATLLVDLIRLIMATIACFLIKKFRRRPLALISGIGTFISLLILSAYTHWVKIYPIIQTGYIPMICLISYIVFVSIGLVPLPSSMNGELFPVQYKGLGCGISSFVAFSMFYSVVQSTPSIFGNYGPSGGFLIFGLVAFISTIFVYFFLPETRGKPLHEIEDAFKR